MSGGRFGRGREYAVEGSIDVDSLVEQLGSLEVEELEPTPMDLEAYEHLREEFVETLMCHPSVVAIYGESESPTVPGISDADFTMIVHDSLEDPAALRRSVRDLNRRYPELLGSGPGILPESLAPFYPLFDRQTGGLNLLAGTPIQPALSPSPLLAELMAFDYLLIDPHAKLIREVLPRPSSPIGGRPHLEQAFKLANMMITTYRGHGPLPADRLVLNKRRGLRLMSFPQHRRRNLNFACSDALETDTEAIDRATEFRSEYFETETPHLEYLRVVVELIACCNRMLTEFGEQQSIYPDAGSYRIKHKFPLLASAQYRTTTWRDEFDLSQQASLAGNVVPPALAYHIANLPNGQACFMGEAPIPTVENDEAREYIRLRREVFTELLSFVHTNDLSTALSGTFSFPHIVNYLHRYTQEDPVTGVGVKRRLRLHRNGRVMERWLSRLRSPSMRTQDVGA